MARGDTQSFDSWWTEMLEKNLPEDSPMRKGLAGRVPESGAYRTLGINGKIIEEWDNGDGTFSITIDKETFSGDYHAAIAMCGSDIPRLSKGWE